MLAPLDAGGYPFAFGLCEGAVDGDEEFAFRIDGVDILLLEDDRDTHATQLAGIAQSVHGVAGEAGYRFGKNHVDLALPALPDHAKKILALAGGGTGDTLIREDIRHRPVGICHDLFRVVCFLVFIAAKLFIFFGGHTAVCSYPEIFLLFLILRRFLLCRDDNDLRFRAGLRHASSHSSKT